MCGVFLLAGLCVRSQHIVGAGIPGKVGLVYVIKVSEQVKGKEPINRILLWSLFLVSSVIREFSFSSKYKIPNKFG